MFLTPEHLIRELNLRPGDKVLEVGSGSGAWTPALAREVTPIGQVYALDIHRDMLHTLADSLIKNNLINVDIVWGDIEKDSKMESYSMDAVVMANVLFQLTDINKALKNVLHILKPDGLLLIVDWSASFGGIGPKPDHVIDSEKIEILLVKNNFRIVKRLPAGKYHYAIMARA